MASEERVVKEDDDPGFVLVVFQVLNEPFGLFVAKLKGCIFAVAVERDDVGVGIVKGIVDFLFFIGQRHIVIIVYGVSFVVAQAGKDRNVFGQATKGIKKLGFPLLVYTATGDQVSGV